MSAIGALFACFISSALAYGLGRDRGYWKGYWSGCKQGHRDARPLPVPAPRLKQRCLATRVEPLTPYEIAEHARIAAMFPIVPKDER